MPGGGEGRRFQIVDPEAVRSSLARDDKFRDGHVVFAHGKQKNTHHLKRPWQVYNQHEAHHQEKL